MNTIKNVINSLEELAPLDFAFDWDNAGLLVGDKNKNVNKILVALDATGDVIDEAIEGNFDLIVTHHPLFFAPIKNILASTNLGTKIMKLIKNDISVYCSHTNLDVCNGGTNDVLANLLNLKNIEVLDITKKEYKYKISVSVPVPYVDKVRESLFESGCGVLGNYSECSFFCDGVGTFRGNENSNPFLGEKNTFTTVYEVKIEVLVDNAHMKNAIKNMIKAHPYEYPIFDCVRLYHEYDEYGLGRTGYLDSPVSFEDFAKTVKKVLKLDNMRIVGNLDKQISKVAVCTGSGVSYFKKVVQSNCDVFISGDLRFHDSQKISDYDLCFIDGTHYATEQIVVEPLVQYLTKNVSNVEVVASKIDGNTFTYI